jgi:hypothetical protein
MKRIGLCLDVAAKVLCAGLLATACSPKDEGGVESVTQALHWRSADTFIERCDGEKAEVDPGPDRVKLYQEWPPNSTLGWCLRARPMITGLGANLRTIFDNNTSTVVLGRDTHVDLWDGDFGRGFEVALFGQGGGPPNVVDLHSLIVEGDPPRGVWADRISSFKTCLKSALDGTGRCRTSD